MDNSTNFSECLAHHSTESIQVRKDIFELCTKAKDTLSTKKQKGSRTKINDASPICMTMIIDILEKITHGAKGNYEEYKITLSYSEISSLLYNAFGERPIIGSLFALVQANYIKKYGINGNTPSYTLNIPVLQAALDEQAGKYQAAPDEQAGKDQAEPNHSQFNEKQLQAIGHTTKKKYIEDELKSLSEEQLKSRLSPKMRETFNNWCSIHKGPIKLSAKLFLALQDLEPFDTSIETLKSVRNFCFTVDKPTKQCPQGYYRTKGVDLWDIVERYSKWHQTKECSEVSPVLTIVGKKQSQGYSSIDDYDYDYDYEAEFYPAKPAIK